MGPKLILLLFCFLHLQIWPLCSQFTWPLQWEVRQKRSLLPWPWGMVPLNTLVSWKKVNQISISDIHTGAEIDFDILFQIDVHSQMWPLIYLAFAMGGPSNRPWPWGTVPQNTLESWKKCKSNQRLRHSQWGQNSFQCLISNLSALANMAALQLIYLAFCSGRSVKRPLLPWPWEMMPHNTLDKK